MAGDETSSHTQSESSTEPTHTSIPDQPNSDSAEPNNPQTLPPPSPSPSPPLPPSDATQPDSNPLVSDVLAKGVSSLLGSVMRDFDLKSESALKSQDRLSSAIDRLTGELDQLLDDAPLPFIMQHAAKISGIRKRVSSLNLLLRSIQRRVDNIDRMLTTGSSHEKPVTDSDRQHQH